MEFCGRAASRVLTEVVPMKPWVVLIVVVVAVLWAASQDRKDRERAHFDSHNIRRSVVSRW